MNVVSIHKSRRVFTIDEARALLPLVIRITADSQREVDRLMNRMEAIKYGSAEAARQVEVEVQETVDNWHQKLSSLGVHPKGLWLADFDFGQGYYCWKYPENDLRYCHGYQDGFTGRKEIQPEGKQHENCNRPNQPHLV